MDRKQIIRLIADFRRMRDWTRKDREQEKSATSRSYMSGCSGTWHLAAHNLFRFLKQAGQPDGETFHVKHPLIPKAGISATHLNLN